MDVLGEITGVGDYGAVLAVSEGACIRARIKHEQRRVGVGLKVPSPQAVGNNHETGQNYDQG